MVSSDRRECRPVDARGGQSLLAIGPEFAEARFMCCAGRMPEIVELRPSSGVESFHGEDRDIAMLGVHPGACCAGCGPCRNSRKRAKPSRSTHLWADVSPEAVSIPGKVQHAG